MINTILIIYLCGFFFTLGASLGSAIDRGVRWKWIVRALVAGIVWPIAWILAAFISFRDNNRLF